MRGLLFYPIFMDVDPEISVNKKCKEIVDAFEKIGHIDMDVVRLTTSCCLFNDEVLVTLPKTKWKRWWFINVNLYHAIWNRISNEKYDFFWIRAPYLTPAFIKFLRKIRSVQRNAKVTLEYGSYPYFNESVGVKRLLLLFDFFNSSKLQPLVDKIITYCGQEKIYNVPAIKLSNGIDVNEIPVAIDKARHQNKLVFISVSSLYHWHGIDRFIIGIRNYVERHSMYSIEFYIVGKGPEFARLQELVASLGLNSCIFFLGLRTGKELDVLFQKADVGIGTLAMHRKSLTADSSLKNREYVARGLPFILATPDKDFPSNLPFVQYIPGDESPVDLQKVIAFYERLRVDPNFNQHIRNFAEKNLDWSIKIKQVLAALIPEHQASVTA